MGRDPYYVTPYSYRSKDVPRFWSVRRERGHRLVCVTVYKRGAEEVARTMSRYESALRRIAGTKEPGTEEARLVLEARNALTREGCP